MSIFSLLVTSGQTIMLKNAFQLEGELSEKFLKLMIREQGYSKHVSPGPNEIAVTNTFQLITIAPALGRSV
jgi:hypothetical protein